MNKMTVTAAEANRSFSKILRAAREGTRVTITAHGEPVANLVPYDGAGNDEAEQHKRQRWLEFIKQLEAQPVTVVGPWTRAELYERG